MAYKSQMLGFGIYLAKGPSVQDPAAVNKWIVSLHIGFWRWSKMWVRGIGSGPGNAGLHAQQQKEAR